MDRVALLCFILLEIVFVLSMANGSEIWESQVAKLGNDDKLMVSMSFKANPPSSNAELLNEKTEDEDEVAEAPEIRRMGKHHHHSSSESMAGGTVIISGLVTTIFAAVFCYIRVTRRHNSSTIDSKI
ncbi:hypothetical protein MKX01_025071 [Papaver californicum]|nr:hypothetical protein MKX01_025071 [Papaver californicum]